MVDQAKKDRYLFISIIIFFSIYRLLNDTEGFDLESRGSDFVPENFVSESNTKPISWFLNSFKYEKSNQSDDCTANIVAALNSLDDI